MTVFTVVVLGDAGWLLDLDGRPDRLPAVVFELPLPLSATAFILSFISLMFNSRPLSMSLTSLICLSLELG